MIRKILGFSIERTIDSNERESRRMAMLEVAKQTVEKLQEAGKEREKHFVRELTDTVERYETLLQHANTRADGMVSPVTVGILQEEIRNLRSLLNQSHERNDKIVDQHHAIAMKEPPSLMQQIGHTPASSDVQNPFGKDFPQSWAVYRAACAGQSRQVRETILSKALEYRALDIKDEQLAKIIRDGEGYRA